MKTTLAHQLATYASSFRFEDLSKEVVHEVNDASLTRWVAHLVHGTKSRASLRETSLPISRRNTDRQSSARITRRRRTGPHSRTAVAFAISITTIRICRKSLPIRATIFLRRCLRRKAWTQMAAN